MFWRAALGVPVFAARFDVGSLAAWCTSQRVALLVGNVVCDHLCKVATTRLIGEASALAATMVITLQRFISLIFSATVLADNPPPPALWVGICMVAFGSAAYARAPSAK
eukprot:2805441-Prymnesium_polylepis.1